MKERFVEVPSTLEVLRPILRTWLDRFEVASHAFPQSEQCYFLEATLVGLLAGAAWSHKLQALTEMKARRSFGDGNQANGRIDLLLKSHDLVIAFEFKIFWDHDLPEDAIDEWLKDTCREVKSVERSVPGQHRHVLLGGVFFVPWWSAQKHKSDLMDRVLPQLRLSRADLRAWHLDSDTEYPGVALFAAIAQ